MVPVPFSAGARAAPRPVRLYLLQQEPRLAAGAGVQHSDGGLQQLWPGAQQPPSPQHGEPLKQHAEPG
jgi:hypothetical protein